MVRTKKTRGLAWLIVFSVALTMCASFLPMSLTRANGEKGSSQSRLGC